MCQSDKACVESCRDGHPEAFRFLVERYQGPLLAHLAGRLGDRDRAEEAVQEAFVRAYAAMHQLKNPESFFSWLFGIADRATKEIQRTEQRHRQLPAMLPERQETPDLSDEYALERAVAELPDVYRQVVLLRYYGRQSCAEVAEQLAVPLGTVTKRLSRAYALLRESLTREGRDPSEVSK